MAQRAGRPLTEVDMKAVKFFKTIGKDIAELMGVSCQTLYNKIRVAIQVTMQHIPLLVIETLDQLVARIKWHHPNNGDVMFVCFLTSEGVCVPRKRLRASIHHVDPAGTEDCWHQAVRRRVYIVPCPNYIWHVDGNHKLICWRFVVHGSIDGYSYM